MRCERIRFEVVTVPSKQDRVTHQSLFQSSPQPRNILGIDALEQRFCYSCSRIAPRRSMTICLDCGSHLCMQDADCKAVCLCDMLGAKVVRAKVS